MNFSKVKPILNRILVQRIGGQTKSPSGLLLPDKSKNLKVGKIIEVGPGRHNAQGQLIKPALSVGQYVMLPDYGGVKLPKGQSKEEPELLIFQEDEIIAVVEGDFDKI